MPTSRIDLRRQQTEQQLQAVAARQCAELGINAVNVEGILKEVNISRRTFYTFFANKHELIASIVKPVFIDGLERLQALQQQPSNTILPAIIEVYLQLWEQYNHAFYLSSQLDSKSFELVANQHNHFVMALQSLLIKLEKNKRLKNNSADYSLKIIARCAVPILKVYTHDKKFKKLYRDTMTDLLASL